MSFFKFLKSFTSGATKPQTLDAKQADSSTVEDQLLFAAEAKEAAKAAVKSGNFDDAWRLLHKVKDHYARHASISSFTASQLRALDGSVHQDLANVLRLEGRDDEALAHIIYWVATSSESLERHDQKLRAYLKRSSFNSVQFEDVKVIVSSAEVNPSFSAIVEKLADWTNEPLHQARHTPDTVEPASPESGKTSSLNDDSIAAAHQLIKVLAEAEPLSKLELERLWRKKEETNKIDFIAIELMEANARETYIAELEAETNRRQKEHDNTPSAEAWANASGDRSNDLALHCLTVKDCFETFLKTGDHPPPHYPWRVAVILRKMKEHQLEKEFLANWVKHFGGTRGTGYEKLKQRYEKLC